MASEASNVSAASERLIQVDSLESLAVKLCDRHISDDLYTRDT